ncbi:MAG: hypothetical protein QOK05_658 [Chloroflexota bacterium]|nr:hypothetical protein [Chloroflexota bacterium]
MTNWNRWGPLDELGAANLLTPDHVLGSLRTAATRGQVYPLAQPLQQDAAPHAGRGVTIHLMEQQAADYQHGSATPYGDARVASDYLFMRVHGAGTHIDALGHVWSGDTLYNGHPAGGSSSRGLDRCAIDRLPAVVTRGVLLDLAATTEHGHLEAEHEITVDELQACARSQGVEIRGGDAVLLRTGWPAVFKTDPAAYEFEFPGLGLAAAHWLSDLDIVLVGADTVGVEVRTRAAPFDIPVHLHLIHEQGIYMLEMLDLEALAADRVHEFLFVAAPLRLTGGTGSPIAPIAIA